MEDSSAAISTPVPQGSGFGDLKTPFISNSLSTGAEVGDLRTLLDVARNLFRARRFDEASSTLATLIAGASGASVSRPGEEEKDRRIRIAQACALTLSGRCQEELSNDECAKQLWTQAAALFDRNLPEPQREGLPSPDLPADVLAYYAIALRKVRRRQEAIAIFRRIIAGGSAAPEIYRHFGLTLEDEGDYSGALEQLQIAAARGPSDVRAWRGLADAEKHLGHAAETASACLGLAQALTRAGEYPAALSAVDESLASNPRDAAALRQRGDLLRVAGRFAEALECFDRALEINPADSTALAAKGAALFNLGRPAEALTALNAAVEKNPDDAWALAAKCDVLTGLGRYSEARPCLERLLQTNTAYAAGHAMLAEVLGQSGENASALEHAQLACRLEPGNPYAQQVLATAYTRAARYPEALEAFDALTRRADVASAARIGKAEVLLALNRTPEALAALDQVLETEPRNAVALSRKGRILLMSPNPADQEAGVGLCLDAAGLDPQPVVVAQIAAFLLEAQKYHAVLRIVDGALHGEAAVPFAWITKARALQQIDLHLDAIAAIDAGLPAIAPQDQGEALAMKAYSLGALHRDSDAEAAFREALVKDQYKDWIYRSFAIFLDNQRRFAESLEMAEQALIRNPADPQNLEAKAHALANLGRLPEAIELVRKTVDANDDQEWLHERLAELYERAGQADDALTELNRCLAINANSATALAARGYLLHSKGEREGAESDLVKAVELDSTLTWAFAELASVRREMEKPAEALQAINQALKAAPDNAEAIEIKGQIFIDIFESQAALQTFDKLPEDRRTLWYWKGVALECLGRLQESLAYFERAHQADVRDHSEDVWTMRALADSLLNNGRREEGEALFDQVLDRMSREPAGLFQLGLCGWCHYGCRRLEPALRLYSESLSLDRQGNLKTGQFDLALILTCSEQYDQAGREYQRARLLAKQAHPWVRKSLFGVALSDLTRAIDQRYPELRSASEPQKFREMLRAGYDEASRLEPRPPLD